MATLYIIGNGFDLAHGLPTKFNHFRSFIYKQTSPRKGKQNMVRFDKYYPTLVAHQKRGTAWKNFEDALGNPDVIEIYHSSTYNVEEAFTDENKQKRKILAVSSLESFQNEINEYLTKWIETIRYENIKHHPTFNGTNDDWYISFNYTETLEEVYGIPNEHIIHIHGWIGESNPKLIIGFSGGLMDDWRSDAHKYMDFECEIFKELTKIAENFVKRTDQIIKKHSLKLKQLSKTNIDKIVVIGHSLGLVDRPYFEKVGEMFPNAQWSFSYYSKGDKKNAQNFITSMNGKIKKCKCFLFK